MLLSYTMLLSIDLGLAGWLHTARESCDGLLLFFLHHPKTSQDIKLKLPDFKDTFLRHILQVRSVLYILSCYHSNKITEGTSQDLAPNKSENQPFVKILS